MSKKGGEGVQLIYIQYNGVGEITQLLVDPLVLVSSVKNLKK
ncbi:hypothetical protein STZ1_11060 [Bacillus subtilis]